MADGYQSSEELQRHNSVFTDNSAEKVKKPDITEQEKVRAVLDKYIKKYSKTTDVRKMAKVNNKSADHQLDVCADVVEILEKIKSELR